ncbi:hypothetical protein PV08_07973 [Exophiala spinifera]|uniref:FAD/NAD(P)-binding domain-containing protein n=1 Tax=Exophiala spinifera TaxID=91928 RepID=A0A0D1YCV2_9EURO|nr:uncharacterized protein PV08_07973 [Exophiala spinifera]KIW12786.1 hypothetical protein PV08_07973 [Exophiala spinifera]
MYILFSLLALLPTVILSSPIWNPTPESHYDVVVVGGGPSGLSALSGLARVRRKALLIDSGQYRNLLTRHVHDVIGSDGVTPAYFRWNARQQISQYPTVSMTNGTVTQIAKLNSSTFSIVDADGNHYTSRKVVVATGLRDILPSTPGIAENWARGIYWCPWCDGYEHRDQPLGLLGAIDKIFGLVLEVDTLDTDLIAFTNGTMTAEGLQVLNTAQPDWENIVKIYNVKIDNRTISTIERIQDGGIVNNIATKTEYDKFLVHFDDGTTAERGAFFTGWPSVQASNVGTDLGIGMKGNKLYNNITTMATNIQGAYAVGDANMDGSTNVPHAMWSGKRAAVDIHLAMAEEDFESAVIAAGLSKRDDDPESDRELLLRYIGEEFENLWKLEATSEYLNFT